MKTHAHTTRRPARPGFTRSRSHLTALSAAGAAAVGLTASPSAEAAILYTDVPDTTITTGGKVYFDLDRSGGGPSSYYAGADFYASFLFSMPEKPLLNGGFGGGPGRHSLSDGGNNALRLALNSPITPSGSWVSFPYLEKNNVGPWQGTAGDAYLGLRLDAGSGNFRYGWARIDYNDAANSITLKDFAIEQTLNTPILAGDVGAVPEPGRALLLALGLGGAALRRRRKAMQA